MAGIINDPPSITDQINNIYQTQFGRPADAEGLKFWSNAAQQNPGGNLSSMIVSGAQTQDKAAASDIAAGGINTSSTWGAGLNTNDVAPQKDVWDAAANKWVSSQSAPVMPAGTMAASQGYTAAQQAPAVSSPITQRTIDPEKETTAGQIRGIINENSPLMQQASARAMQAANDRGLGNSSLAVGAAQGALYSAATPIASADANIYGNAATLNTNTQNQFTAQKDAVQNQINTNNTGAINNASAFGADSGNKASLQNASLSTQASIAASNNASSKIIAGLNNDSQLAITKLNDANKEILQTDASAASLHAQAMQTIAGIQSNPNIADKVGSINQVLATLNNSLSIMGLIGKDLDFSTAPIATQP